MSYTGLIQVSSGTEYLRKAISIKSLYVPEYEVIKMSDISPVKIGDVLQSSIDNKFIFQGSRYSYPQAWGDFWELLIMRELCMKLGFLNCKFMKTLKLHCDKIIELFMLSEYDMTETFFNEDKASIYVLEDIWTMVFIKSIRIGSADYEYVSNRLENIPIFYEDIFNLDNDIVLINELCSTSSKIADCILSLSVSQNIDEDVDMSVQIITEGLNGIPDIRICNNLIDIKCYPNKLFKIKKDDHLQMLAYCAMYKTKGVHIDDILFINPITGQFMRLNVSEWVDEHFNGFIEAIKSVELTEQYNLEILSRICCMYYE